jgi:hypothetical protein
MATASRAAPLLALALLPTACGSGASGTPDAASPDAAGDTSPPPDSSALDAGPADSSPSDASSLADVIVYGPPTCTPQPGSRIKVRYYQAPDGTRIFDSMYDSMLDASCAAATTSDGKLRCLPGSGFEAVLYTDMTCTTPVMQQSDYDCTTPAYVLTGVSAGTCTTPRTLAVYAVGAELPDAGADAGALFVKNGTSCTPQPAFVSTIYNYYALTPVADSTFVEGTAGTATAGNYSMRTVVYSDGARFCDYDYGFTDSRTQLTAYSTQATDGNYYMFPSAPEPAGFADSKCTTPAAGAGTLVDWCGPLPPYVTQLDQCTFLETIRSVGGAIDGGFGQDYAPDGSIECLPQPAPEGGAWNAVSPPLPPSMFDPIGMQPSGTGRLQTLAWATYGGFGWLEPDEAYDSQLKTACYAPRNSAAATAACLPTTTFNAGALYSEGTCTQPLYLVSMQQSCVPSGFPAAGTLAYVASCPPRMAHVGAPYTGVMWQKVGNTCNQVGFPDDAFWSIVDDIPPSTYVPLTAVVE